MICLKPPLEIFKSIRTVAISCVFLDCCFLGSLVVYFVVSLKIIWILLYLAFKVVYWAHLQTPTTTTALTIIIPFLYVHDSQSFNYQFWYRPQSLYTFSTWWINFLAKTNNFENHLYISMSVVIWCETALINWKEVHKANVPL